MKAVCVVCDDWFSLFWLHSVIFWRIIIMPPNLNILRKQMRKVAINEDNAGKLCDEYEFYLIFLLIWQKIFWWQINEEKSWNFKRIEEKSVRYACWMQKDFTVHAFIDRFGRQTLIRWLCPGIWSTHDRFICFIHQEIYYSNKSSHINNLFLQIRQFLGSDFYTMNKEKIYTFCSLSHQKLQKMLKSC